jgi:hypothetical protein
MYPSVEGAHLHVFKDQAKAAVGTLTTRLQSNKQKNFEKKNLFFVGIFKATDEQSLIRIRKSAVRIRIRTSFKTCSAYCPSIVEPLLANQNI